MGRREISKAQRPKPKTDWQLVGKGKVELEKGKRKFQGKSVKERQEADWRLI